MTGMQLIYTHMRSEFALGYRRLCSITLVGANSHADDHASGALLIVCDKRALDHSFAFAELGDSGPQFDAVLHWCRAHICHRYRARDVLDLRIGSDTSIFCVICRGGRSSEGMAVDDARDYPTVQDAGGSHVLRPGVKLADRLIANPVALYLQAKLVSRPACPAVTWDSTILYRNSFLVNIRQIYYLPTSARRIKLRT